MFKNIPTQDLLSDSQRSSNYSNDSALFSLSQRQQSQNDFSQVRTQDLFTQNHNSGSMSESSFPASKKPSMYDKWMSKGALFRKEGMKTAGSMGHLQGQHQQQQQQQLNVNKPRDSENRDLMQQVVTIVQDCNKEVKNALSAVREKLQSTSEGSGEKLTDAMKAFLEDVWKHEERMLQAIEEGKNYTEKSHQLEKQLTAKDAVIQQLQSQLEERSKAGDVKQVAKAVREEMLSPHLAVENKLMEILEVTREVSEQHTEQLSQYHSQLTSQAKDFKEWKTTHQKVLKDMEKRLVKDISSVWRELQKEDEEWRNSIQDQLTEACSSHLQDMESLLEKAVSDCIAASTTTKQTSNVTMTSSVVTAVKKELQAIFQKQTKATEKNLKTMSQQQADKQQQQLQHLQHNLLAMVTDSLQSISQQLQDKPEEDTPLTVPAFEEKIEEYQADIKKQLEDMHRHHVEEVKKLQKDASLPDRFGPLRSTPKFSNSLIDQNEGPEQGLSKTTEYPLQRRKGMAKISPLSKEDRVSLFSRTNPSPVAAVLPQQQVVKPSSALKEQNVAASTSESDMEVVLQKQPAPPDQEIPKPAAAKKRKASKGRKKTAVRRRKAVKVVETESCSSHSQPRKITATQQLTVYDFSDDQSPEMGRPLLKSFQLPGGGKERNEICSPSASTESCLSSPAMSVTVDTEMVWVRRSRWQTYSSSRQIQAAGCPMTVMTDHNSSMDMLSSPFMSTAKTATQQLHRPFPRLETATQQRSVRSLHPQSTTQSSLHPQSTTQSSLQQPETTTQRSMQPRDDKDYLKFSRTRSGIKHK